MTVEIAGLTHPELGWVGRDAYRNPEIYAAEQERIFKRCWLFLGHESQIPAKGDFFTTYLGEEPVIVTRGDQGRIHAFINSCRHRGMRVCRADRGNARAFTCPYHAWTYDMSGALIGVPKSDEGYYGELDRSQYPLIPVAQVDSYKGLIFGTFDPRAPTLVDYLGDMAWYLDLVLDRCDGGTELLPGVHKWVVRTNWKISCDNNAGDWYHVAFSHGSLARLQNRPNLFREDERRLQVSAENGHTLALYFGDATVDPSAEGPHAEWRRKISAQIEERLGPVRSRLIFIAGNVFPNFGWIPGQFSIRQFHPRGPDRIEIWSYCLVDAAAPPEAKAAMRLAYVNSFGPGGLVEQDDGENWTGCAGSIKGPVTGEYAFNYQMGLGHEWRDDRLKARAIGRATSEVVHRSFYGRWRAEMIAES